jgi:regulator of sigma E protease
MSEDDKFRAKDEMQKRVDAASQVFEEALARKEKGDRRLIMSLVIFILMLALLIVVHELGHFSVAKLFNIKVEEFGIGFPPRLLKFQKGETTYSLNLLFFGGFVKIFGENHNEAANNPRSFAGKSRWIQAAVVVAGIVMNIVFAWFALSVGYMVGIPSSVEHQGFGTVENPKATIVALLPDSPAQKAGIEPGDTIDSLTAATGHIDPTPDCTTCHINADEVREFIKVHQNESIILSIRREGGSKNILVQPKDGLIDGRKALGVQLDDVGTLRLPVHLAFLQGAILTYDMTIATAEGLGKFFYQIVTGNADFGSVAGPIGIAGIGAKAVKTGFDAAVTLVALISINLAIINLLPIPGLDGGRLLIILIEGVTRRPVPQKISVAITVVGFALLITLMVVVSYHDIARLIG